MKTASTAVYFVPNYLGLCSVKVISTENSVQRLRNKKLNQTKCDFWVKGSEHSYAKGDHTKVLEQATLKETLIGCPSPIYHELLLAQKELFFIIMHS